MSNNLIIDKLLDEGKRLFNSPPKFIEFTNIAEANVLLNDIENYPHAYVLACIMDRRIKAEKAWSIPFFFRESLGDFEFSTLLNLGLEDILEIMSNPRPLHILVKGMSKYMFLAIEHIHLKYDNDASQIWYGEPSSAEVVYRFLEFEGIGPKIATMATNILARDFKVKFSDYYAIDVSADVHVKRVLSRLGITNKEDSVEAVIYKIRSLYPEYPGLIDWPLWYIGRNLCHPKKPNCNECYMNKFCDYACKNGIRDLTAE